MDCLDNLQLVVKTDSCFDNVLLAIRFDCITIADAMPEHTRLADHCHNRRFTISYWFFALSSSYESGLHLLFGLLINHR